MIRKESPEWLTARPKLVRPDFVQHIGAHWRRRAVEWNQIDRARAVTQPTA